MALNKFMHSRNIYKNPPDFVKLAKMFTEFSSIAKMDITGKVTIDFKDPKSLRILTKCLLKCDFKLDVEIPEDRLVPTLPLRLNYILWLEDLITSINRHENIWGIDIGTGACAIYPLLGATKNRWHFVATETDKESLVEAQTNIERNNLLELIELKKNPTKSLIEFLFVENYKRTFDFCMCNPPFYSNIQELYESRSPARPLPKNGFTGSPQELITEGGELQFCRKLIKESRDFKDKVLVFTTMVGHKYNIKELIRDLQIEGVNYTSTEFCQGRVTRWGLAWTYNDYKLYKLLPPREKLRKKSEAITCLLSPLSNNPYDFVTVSKKLISIFSDLNISYIILNKKGDSMSLDISALTNTWSNQRRKRRLMKRQKEEAKKRKLDQDMVANCKYKNVVKTDCCENGSIDSLKSVQYELQINNSTTTKSDQNAETVSGNVNNQLVHAVAKILKKDNNFILAMEFLDGIAGKEGLHQIMQYIKNNWK